MRKKKVLCFKSKLSRTLIVIDSSTFNMCRNFHSWESSRRCKQMPWFQHGGFFEMGSKELSFKWVLSVCRWLNLMRENVNCMPSSSYITRQIFKKIVYPSTVLYVHDSWLDKILSRFLWRCQMVLPFQMHGKHTMCYFPDQLKIL